MILSYGAGPLLTDPLVASVSAGFHRQGAVRRGEAPKRYPVSARETTATSRSRRLLVSCLGAYICTYVRMLAL